MLFSILFSILFPEIANANWICPSYCFLALSSILLELAILRPKSCTSTVITSSEQTLVLRKNFPCVHYFSFLIVFPSQVRLSLHSLSSLSLMALSVIMIAMYTLDISFPPLWIFTHFSSSRMWKNARGREKKKESRREVKRDTQIGILCKWNGKKERS